MSVHCVTVVRGFPSHNRYDGLYPFQARQPRLRVGVSAQSHKTREWRDRLQQSESSRPKQTCPQLPAGPQQKHDGRELKTHLLRSPEQNPRRGANGRREERGPSQVPTFQGGKSLTRHSTAGRMRAEGCTGTSGCPAAFPDAAARTRASVRRSRTPETHPTRCHTGRNEAVLTSEDSSLERRLPGRQSPASSGWRRLPRPPQLTLFLSNPAARGL